MFPHHLKPAANTLRYFCTFSQYVKKANIIEKIENNDYQKEGKANQT